MKQILSNDMVRRLQITDEGLPADELARVVDGYGDTLLRSGHDEGRVTEIITAGIRRFERKLERCRKDGRNLYRTAQESQKAFRR